MASFADLKSGRERVMQSSSSRSNGISMDVFPPLVGSSHAPASPRRATVPSSGHVAVDPPSG